MSTDEQTQWDLFNRRLKTWGVSPCADCLAPFAKEMGDVGLCDGYPGRVRYQTFTSRQGVHGRSVLSDEERHQRRLASWRKYRAKKRAGG